MPGLYSHTTRATGTTLTAAIYNSDHVNHVDNLIPTMVDDYSVDLTQSRLQTDPATLATSLAGELERLRFAIAKIGGVSFWDQATRAILGPSLTSLAETTTSSTTAVDIKSLTGLSIGVGSGLLVMANLRKTAGAAATASIGLKLNATQIFANTAWSSGTNQAEDGWIWALIWRRATNYQGGGVIFLARGGGSASVNDVEVAIPNATITDVVLTGLVGSASITLGVADAVVYELKTS